MKKTIFLALSFLFGLNAIAFSAPITLNSVTITLSNSQIKSLNTSPVTILAGQGSGVVTIPVSIQTKLIYGGSNAFEASGSTNISYNASQSIANINNSVFWERTLNYYALSDPGSQISPFTAYENEPITISSTSKIMGNVSNDNTAEVNLVYYTVNL